MLTAFQTCNMVNEMYSIHFSTKRLGFSPV
ncbi:hypothetical protein ABH903_001185 [Brevibacterium epidermidis]|jgi:hypothetical protein|uniref:Uncharacterized protein n=1 Tax=Brevibacterium epidermidis TaxID=1698 RepID=A0ABV4EI22_BREEP